ncbi:hypothetical protein R3P38DRAFT_2792315 [Favolaschia claudopus]|uniref:Uncharacterized protein n=1 Tax=Favolaschia claudopus TaxID=2862362 RepID=A0AAW0AFH5_9AGAR
MVQWVGRERPESADLATVIELKSLKELGEEAKESSVFPKSCVPEYLAQKHTAGCRTAVEHFGKMDVWEEKHRQSSDRSLLPPHHLYLMFSAWIHGSLFRPSDSIHNCFLVAATNVYLLLQPNSFDDTRESTRNTVAQNSGATWCVRLRAFLPELTLTLGRILAAYRIEEAGVSGFFGTFAVALNYCNSSLAARYVSRPKLDFLGAGDTHENWQARPLFALSLVYGSHDLDDDAGVTFTSSSAEALRLAFILTRRGVRRRVDVVALVKPLGVAATAPNYSPSTGQAKLRPPPTPLPSSVSRVVPVVDAVCGRRCMGGWSKGLRCERGDGDEDDDE